MEHSHCKGHDTCYANRWCRIALHIEDGMAEHQDKGRKARRKMNTIRVQEGVREKVPIEVTNEDSGLYT